MVHKMQANHILDLLSPWNVHSLSPEDIKGYYTQLGECLDHVKVNILQCLDHVKVNIGDCPYHVIVNIGKCGSCQGNH